MLLLFLYQRRDNMAFTVNIRNNPLEIKFNYRIMFKANKELGTIDEKGNKNTDGASNLFIRVLNQDDTAIFDLIKLVFKGGKALTDDEIFDAIEERFEGVEDEAKAYDELFNDMKEEMLESGFFMRKLSVQIENMEKGKKMLAEKTDETSQMQVKQLDELINSLKKEIS